MSAQQAMKAEMEKENLITYFDSVGNLFGRLEGTGSSGGIILAGSHIDTVKDGGRHLAEWMLNLMFRMSLLVKWSSVSISGITRKRFLKGFLRK